MATLHVRSVPDELYARLQEIAEASNRSLSAQVITLLEAAVEAGHERQGPILDRMWERRFTPRPGTPDSVELLREDRKR